MKKNFYATFCCMLTVLFVVICVFSCQESTLEDMEQKTTQVLDTNTYPEFLNNVKSYVASLPEEQQNHLYSVCSNYLQSSTNKNDTETINQIIELCNVSINDLDLYSGLKVNDIYKSISTAYSFLPVANTTTRNSNCETQRDAALKDLALKYEIEIAAACLVGPASSGIVTVVAVVAITATTEIDRQAIHRAYDKCVKNS